MAAAYACLFGDVFDESSESDGDGERNITQIPFSINEIPERLLFQRTRLDRTVFTYVLNLISPTLEQGRTGKGRRPRLSPCQKLYVTLQFYATGTYQWLAGNSGRISQAATSRAIREVTDALVTLLPQFVRFPEAEEYVAVKQGFYAFGHERHGTGFPNVLGAIDCTHVRLQSPNEHPEQYLNRHLYHSINVQLIVGPDLKVFNVFAEFPGSNHDSFIWRNSAVRDSLTEGNFPEGWLVGDSGYPQEPWLMTPVLNPTTPAEHLYNSVHISTRNVVERTNGVLKSRWHVLDSPLAYTPGRVCSIAAACCVLHNICTEYKLDVEHLQEYPVHDEPPMQALGHDNTNNRTNLIQTHFTRL